MANTLGRNGAGILVTSVSSSTISENDGSGNGTGIRLAEVRSSGHGQQYTGWLQTLRLLWNGAHAPLAPVGR